MTLPIHVSTDHSHRDLGTELLADGETERLYALAHDREISASCNSGSPATAPTPARAL